MSKKNIKNLNFYDLSLGHKCFTNLHIRNIYIKDASIVQCTFKNCIFERINLIDAYFLECIFENCQFINISNRSYSLANNSFLKCEGLPKIHCSEKGSFIGYKKGKIATYAEDYKRNKLMAYYEECLIKLEIPEDALRSSAFGNKCRCSKAKVLSIISLDMFKKHDSCNSMYYRGFTYTVGETVEVNDFDLNRWNECSTGIHFFMTVQEAINY